MRYIIWPNLVIMLFLNFANGQNFYNQGSQISISDNTTVLFPDSIVNNGEITNNGSMIIRGAWINNNTYNPGLGSITLASSAPQKINHNDQSLNRLTISGGGEKIFEQDIVVEDQLIMDDGLLISSNNARIIVNDGASIIGATENSYIVGEVVHRGTGLKNFPVGTTDSFLPFELLDVQGTSPELGVSAYANNINLETVGTLDEVSSRWYWEMTLINGDFSGSQVRLAINQESLNGSIDQFVVAESLTSDNPFRSLGQSEVLGDTFDGFVTSTLFATGGIYAVGLDMAIIEERPALNVFNAVTPNGDNRHEFLKIENIHFYPDNLVVIFNRLGKKVFEIEGYNNIDRIFNGFSQSNGSELLANGTYYYFIEKNDGSDPISGYFVLNK